MDHMEEAKCGRERYILCNSEYVECNTASSLCVCVCVCVCVCMCRRERSRTGQDRKNRRNLRNKSDVSFTFSSIMLQRSYSFSACIQWHPPPHLKQREHQVPIAMKQDQTQPLQWHPPPHPKQRQCPLHLTNPITKALIKGCPHQIALINWTSQSQTR